MVSAVLLYRDGPVSIKHIQNIHFVRYIIFIIKITQSLGCLIFIMEISMLARWERSFYWNDPGSYFNMKIIFPCRGIPIIKTKCPMFMVSWWRHQMETFSTLLALCAGNSPVNSEFPGQWHRALMFSLICAWINGWVNYDEAGDLRCHRTHYEVIAMYHQGLGFLKQICVKLYIN